jgi:hypothetical protein
VGDENQPDKSLADPGQTPPDGSPAGDQAGGQGDSWSPEQQAAYTKARQKDKAELEDVKRQLRADFDERLAELKAQVAPRPEPGLPDGITQEVVQSADSIFQHTPAFKRQAEEMQRLRRQLSEHSIAAGMESLREEPYFNEVRGEVEAELRKLAAQSDAPLTRGTARFAFMDKVYPKVVQALKGAQDDAEKARKEKADALSQATGSVSGASGGESDLNLSDEEMGEAIDGLTGAQLAQVLGGRRPG